MGVVDADLSNLLQLLTPLYRDTDKSVGHALHLFLKSLFCQVPAERIAPFFELIVVGVRCGLTHINHCVQLNSMKCMDTVLSSYPDFIRPHINELLPLYLPLIARQSFALKSKARSHVDTRVQVLKQLYSFLSLVNIKSIAAQPCPPVIDPQRGVVWTNESLSSPRDLHDYYANSLFLLRFNRKHRFFPATAGDASKATACEDKFVSALIKLLLELWVEEVGKSLTLDCSRKGSSVVELLQVILQILSLSMGLVGKEALPEKLSVLFLSRFPLFQSCVAQRPSAAGLPLNLEVCRVLLQACSPHRHFPERLEPVMKYLATNVSRCAGVIADSLHLTACVKLVIDILQVVSSTKWTENVTRPFFKSCVELFTSCNMLSSAKHVFLVHIDHMTVTCIKNPGRISKVAETSFLSDCMTLLPALLVSAQSTSKPHLLAIIIRIIKFGMTCQRDAVMSAFMLKLPDIYSKCGHCRVFTDVCYRYRWSCGFCATVSAINVDTFAGPYH